MEFIRITKNELHALWRLQLRYKEEIGEDAPDEAAFCRLGEAVQAGQILFFGCRDGEKLIGCCSVSPTFSTFHYRRSGVFEDFYIDPAYRRRGIARALVRFAWENSGVGSLTVGCADCDVPMYRALGFDLPLGNLLAFSAQTVD